MKKACKMRRVSKIIIIIIFEDHKISLPGSCIIHRKLGTAIRTLHNQLHFPFHLNTLNTFIVPAYVLENF